MKTHKKHTNELEYFKLTHLKVQSFFEFLITFRFEEELNQVKVGNVVNFFENGVIFK